MALVQLPRCRCLSEEPGFAEIYTGIAQSLSIRGNLVPEAHIAALLRQHGVARIYSNGTDFRKFEFLEVINPLS
ncbi:MAG TPA: hypothetical protein VJ952_12165 [Opitutales bacterium]|nr:hypothetical protein [Opitutales bacterium]